MVLDSGSPQSVISPGVEHELLQERLLQPAPAARVYHVRNLRADGHPLPDLTVRVHPRLSRLQVDGLLGLDFFGAFELTCFRLSTSQLLLE
jgi:hypothetical protein